MAGPLLPAFQVATPALVAGVHEWILLALIGVGFLAGIGITAIGPGGVFVTIALYAVTGLGPTVVAGTASATNIAAGVVGSLAYARSGELLARRNQRLALVVSTTSVVGALLGVRINTVLPKRLFGLLLGGLIMAIGALVWYRERSPTRTNTVIAPGSRTGLAVGGAVGLGVGVPAGSLGIGGPVLAVPVLTILGVPLLAALAVAQVQSVVIAGAATVGYLSHGAVSMPLVLVIGIPELAGIVIGWRVAGSVDARRLKRVLAATLAVLGPYVMFRP